MASIKERNGAYQITVSMGRDMYGKQILKYTTYTPEAGLTPKKRQKAVEAFAYAFEQKCMNGQLLEGEKTTLKDFVTRWTAEKAQQELQPGTLEKYQAVIDSFILPALGHLKLSEIKPHTVNAFFCFPDKRRQPSRWKAGRLQQRNHQQGFQCAFLHSADCGRMGGHRTEPL